MQDVVLVLMAHPIPDLDHIPAHISDIDVARRLAELKWCKFGHAIGPQNTSVASPATGPGFVPGAACVVGPAPP